MAERSRRQVKKNQDLQRILYLEKERSRMLMIRRILKKPCLNRTEEEIRLINEAPDLVNQIQNNIRKLKCLKERSQEIIDEPEVLSAKCIELAKALKESSFTVVYTGAGISTVLRRYPGLWSTNRPSDKRPKLYIVNLQWTPKDPQATLKIHGKCDEVMKQVTSFLGLMVPKYEKQNDPIFKLATPLLPHEMTTTTRLHLTKIKTDVKDDFKTVDLKENLNIQVSIEDELDIHSNNDELLRTTESKQNLQPFVKLIDIASTNSLLKLNAEQIDSRTYFIKTENAEDTIRTNTNLSGWYGKGLAKWKKQKRNNSSCKRIRTGKDKIE
ncbi:UNVERIFIED_CONTAM: NAD-dependent protein deacetylase sirtuin-7 [Trichonephila clavipes]